MSLKMESSAMEYNIGSLPSTHLTGMINDFNRIIKQKKWSVTKYLSNIFARSFTDERMAYVLTTKVSCAERNNISINGVYAIKKKKQEVLCKCYAAKPKTIQNDVGKHIDDKEYA